MGRNRNRGIALAWAAIVLVVMVGIVGLSIDWGKVSWNVGQMQNAADAAALAGAHFVRYDQERARDWAVKLGLANVADGTAVSLDRNDGNAEDGDVVLGYWNKAERTFTPTIENPNSCKVVVKRNSEATGKLKLVFGPGFGAKDAAATRPAIALSIASMGAGIICLSEDPASLLGPPRSDSGLTGAGAIIDLRGPDGWIGDIQVNSRSDDDPQCAVNVNGVNTEITAGEINTCGTTDPDADDYDGWADITTRDTNVYGHMPYIDDPLRNEPQPVISSMTQYGTAPITDGTLTLEPGWYPFGLNLSGGSITLRPGVYAFGGGKDGKSGFVVGPAEVTGNGVLIFVTGDAANSVENGRIDISGNAVMNLVSRGDAAIPKEIDGGMGVILWQDRENDSYAKIAGGGTCDMTGTIYARGAKLSLSGEFDQMGNQILVGALDVSGSVRLGVGYDGRNFIRSQRSALVK